LDNSSKVVQGVGAPVARAAAGFALSSSMIKARQSAAATAAAAQVSGKKQTILVGCVQRRVLTPVIPQI
jgi:hypothetical protein